jgi:diguanylate cyclase (GGDEF)-like protein
MYTNFATLDKYLNIVTGSPDFFRFVGATNHASLLKMVHENDLQSVKDAVHSLTDDEVKTLVIMMQNHEGKYVWVYIRLKYLKNNTKEEEKMIEFEMLEIEKTYEHLVDDDVRLQGLRNILSYYRNLIFEYNPETSDIIFYYVETNLKHVVYKGNIDTIARDFISDGLIQCDYVATFRDLIRDIKGCASKFTYNILNSLSSCGKKSVMDIVTGCTVFCNNKPTLVMGTFASESNRFNSGMESTHYEKEPMTGLLNKPSIIQYAKDKINARTDENIVIAIVDMDNFKNVNDNLGHSFGDTVIIRFSEILTSVVGDNGAVGRFGGDEFLIVFDNIPTAIEKRNFLRSIRTNVEAEFKNLGDDVSVTCSIGCVCCPSDGNEYETLFTLADKCLYLAKEFGKNRYIILDERTQKNINADVSVGLERSNRVTDNIDFIYEINNMLFTGGKDAIPAVLENVNEKFGLSSSKIFFGDDMKLIYSCGNLPNQNTTANYVFDENYEKYFEKNNLNVLEKIDILQMYSPEAYEKLSRQNIMSVIQCLIRDETDNNKIVGLISFELLPPGRCWHETDINSLAVFGQLMSQILVRNKNI